MYPRVLLHFQQCVPVQLYGSTAVEISALLTQIEYCYGLATALYCTSLPQMMCEA
jgi:hypothetical protein